MSKIYTEEELQINFITSKQIDDYKPELYTQGLSQALIDELSTDNTDEGIICLLKIKVEENKWLKLTSNSSKLHGQDEQGRPIYKTTWNGEDYLYYPFSFTWESLKATGELIGASLRAVNYSYEIAQILENPTEAIPIYMYVLSKKELELIEYSEKLLLTNYTMITSEISGNLGSYQFLQEQVPFSCFYPSGYRF